MASLFTQQLEKKVTLNPRIYSRPDLSSSRAIPIPKKKTERHIIPQPQSKMEKLFPTILQQMTKTIATMKQPEYPTRPRKKKQEIENKENTHVVIQCWHLILT